MSAQRERTANVRFARLCYGFLHIGIPICVCLLALCQVFVTAEPRTRVKVLGLAMAVAVMALFNIVRKCHMSSLPYLILIALNLIISALTPLLWVAAIYTFLDDIWFRPCFRRYSELYRTNREIDRALGDK